VSKLPMRYEYNDVVSFALSVVEELEFFEIETYRGNHLCWIWQVYCGNAWGVIPSKEWYLGFGEAIRRKKLLGANVFLRRKLNTCTLKHSMFRLYDLERLLLFLSGIRFVW